METKNRVSQPTMRRLGQTDISLTAIALGGMPMSISGRPAESQSIATIHKALDLGVNLIDTSDAYCLDESDKHHNERLIHKAIQQYEGDTSQILVATKGGLMRPNGSWTQNGSPDHLRKAIRESHAALGGQEPIALWQYHSPDPNYSIKDSLTPVKEAVAEGLIRFVGVSNFSVEQIKRAREVVEIVSVQNQYNPWHRQPESDGVLDYCQAEGLTFLPWSPLGGSRRVKELSNVAAIAQLAQDKQISVYALVLAWMLTNPCIVPIPGATKPESIADSMTAAQVTLTDEDIAAIDRATRL